MSTASEQLAEAQKQAEALEAKIKALKDQTRDEDLATVKRLIETHGFTQTDLRSVLKTRQSRSTPRKSTRGRSKKSG